MNKITSYFYNFFFESQKHLYLKLILIGFLTALAHAPTHLIPFAFLGIATIFYRTINCENKKEAFRIGWFFGFGYFIASIYWFSIALLTEPDLFAWMIPFAVFGISAVLAIYFALNTLILYATPIKGNVNKIIFFATTWTILEILRAHLFSGFPWNLIAYSWSFSTTMLQITSIVGVYGLGFISILIFILPFEYFKSNETGLKKYKHPILSFIILSSILTYGAIRLYINPTEYLDEKVRVVQANINQHQRWDSDRRFDILRKHLTMSKIGSANIKYTIWPESGMPFALSKDSDWLNVLKQAVPKNGYLLTGALRRDETSTEFKIWNTLFVINQKGQIEDFYDKNHLVPFGEYVPLQNILPLQKITHGMKDFSQGNGLKTILDDKPYSFSPLICYEGIFTNNVINELKKPNLMVNVTNDAWFGNSSGPYQHYAMVKMRSIEEGIPLVRAANTGISAITDAYGREIVKTRLQEEIIFDSLIPKNSDKNTIYSVFRLYSLLPWIIFFAIFVRFWEKM